MRNCLSCGAVRRGTLLLTALVVGATVACSDPRAGTLPTTPSSTPTTPTPATTSPVSYAAELRAALKTYFDTLYAAGMDPANKTDDLAALIHPTCTCRRVLDVLREEARLGRHIDYRYDLRRVRVITVSGGRGHVRYSVHRSAGSERDESGRVYETYPEVVENYSVTFVQVNGRWLLERVTRFA